MLRLAQLEEGLARSLPGRLERAWAMAVWKLEELLTPAPLRSLPQLLGPTKDCSVVRAPAPPKIRTPVTPRRLYQAVGKGRAWARLGPPVENIEGGITERSRLPKVLASTSWPRFTPIDEGVLVPAEELDTLRLTLFVYSAVPTASACWVASAASKSALNTRGTRPCITVTIGGPVAAWWRRLACQRL